MTVQKLAYTFEEASEQCGYSVGVLKQAVTDGNLVARYVGTEVVIRHEDLAAWIGQLPTKPNTGTNPIKGHRAVLNETNMPCTDPKPTTTRQPRAPQLPLPEHESGWLTAEDLAKTWQIAVGTVSNWRTLKKGPEFVRIGGLVRYSPEAVKAWVEKQPRD